MTPTCEDIFEFQFVSRRKALITAFTEDLELLVRKCYPSGDEAVCLYGHPDGTWEVREPEEYVPCDEPEPCCGINWQMNSMSIDEWINSLAMRSDAWLLRVISAIIGHYRLDRGQRGTLFEKIFSLDTILEEVTCYYRRNNVPDNVKEIYDARCLMSPGGSLTKLISEHVQKINEKEKVDVQGESSDQPHKRKSEKCYPEEELVQERSEEKQDVEGENSEDLCGRCGGKYKEVEFWICCDDCEIWFHGDCVSVTIEEADFIKKFKCPLCKQKKHHRAKRKKYY